MQEYLEQNQNTDPLEKQIAGPAGRSEETGQFHKGEDGKYHWIYYMQMLKNNHLFRYVTRFIIGTLLIVILIFGILTIKDDPKEFFETLIVMVPVVFVVYLITAVAYRLVAKMYNNVYCMAYDMDEECITFSQVSDQAEISRLLGAAAAITGATAKSSGMILAGIASYDNAMTSEFRKVNTVTVDRKNHFIGLRQNLYNNMVYADDPYFDFIADYIVQRAVNAKIKIQ